ALLGSLHGRLDVGGLVERDLVAERAALSLLLRRRDPVVVAHPGPLLCLVSLLPVRGPGDVADLERQILRVGEAEQRRRVGQRVRERGVAVQRERDILLASPRLLDAYPVPRTAVMLPFELDRARLAELVEVALDVLVRVRGAIRLEFDD